MANDTDDAREHGIDFGSLADDLEDESYPLSHEILLSRYGDYELDLVGEQVTLREVLPTDHEQEYEDVEGVRQTLLNMVSDEAVGREEYSDRGGSNPESEDSSEMDSF